MKLLRFLQDCEQFTGIDGKFYPPQGNIKKEDIMPIPDENAVVFVGVKAAVEIDLPKSKFEVTLAPDVLETWGKPLPDITDEEASKEIARAEDEIHRKAENQEWLERLRAIGREVVVWEEPPQDEKGKDAKKKKPSFIINYPLFALRLSELFHIIGFGGDPWIYQDGKYMRGRGELENTILEILGFGGVKGKGKDVASELIFRVTYSNNHVQYPFNPFPDLIPVKNGILKIDLKTKKIKKLPHAPDYRFTYQLPVDYDASASVDPVNKVLETWIPDTKNLLQLPAQAILQATGRIYKKSYIFEGARDAGKSTYFLLLTRFMGDENIAGVDLWDLCKNRFALSNLEFKLMNIYDDMQNFPLEYVGRYKKITGSINHRIERKGTDAYDGVLTAVHAFSCNSPPSVGPIEDDAFWRRFNYQLFPSMFELDPSWADKTFTPIFLSGFLNLVIQYILEILEKNALITDALPEETKDMWVSATEPLMNFIMEYTDKSPDLHIAHDVFYPVLVKYCQENKLRVDSKRRVTILMDKMGYHSTQVRIPGGGRPRVYTGLKWKEDHLPRKDASLVSPLF